MKGMMIWMLAFALTWYAQAQNVAQYNGEARNSDGSIAYLEKHKVNYSKTGDVLNSQTEYLRASGEVIGRLNSDFSRSITAPTYTFEDLRDGSSHGLEFDGQNYVLWRAKKDGKKENKTYKTEQFKKEDLVVGCQGLHYYLIKNLDALRQRKDVHVKYLIPGKLDYYSFILNVDNETNDHINLSVKVQNIFLRAFVSTLKLSYRKKDNRLTNYSGLSNISTDSGHMQNVNIAYDFNEPPRGFSP